MNWAKIITLLALSVAACAQIQSAPPPQTARQALLEMLFSKSPKAFEKHVPEQALEIFNKADSGWSAAYLGPLSTVQRQITIEGTDLQTFETGPLLLTAENTKDKQQQRIEVGVERDDLSGEDDQIELSLHIYKDGMPNRLPIVPGLILDFKQEKDIWRLSQITVALRIPLSDPDYVQGIAEEMRKNRQRRAEYGASSLIQQMKEKEMARQKKSGGFTCNLSELGFAPEASTVLTFTLDSNQPPATPPTKDYSFKITGCSSSGFEIAAEPLKGGAARRAFCIDETGAAKFANDGKGSSCISGGTPIEEMWREDAGSRGGLVD